MLPLKRQRFVEEYLKDCNATQAAIRAGYSPHTANEQGSQLLRILSVQQAIAEAQKQIQEKSGLRPEDVIRGLQVEALDRSEGSTAAARVSAWSWIGKNLGMFIDRHRLEGGVTLEFVEEIVEVPADETHSFPYNGERVKSL